TLGFVSQPLRGCLPGPPLSFQSQMYKLQTCSEAAGLDQYVEESDQAQRRHARIRRRSRSFMNKAG
ncbi:MAG: hypothetical protein JXA73_11375, partial [Acidobacteria bacterium]|nr:hypothetical protein [Acidobacteriota bacterium]